MSGVAGVIGAACGIASVTVMEAATSQAAPLSPWIYAGVNGAVAAWLTPRLKARTRGELAALAALTHGAVSVLLSVFLSPMIFFGLHNWWMAAAGMGAGLVSGAVMGLLGAGDALAGGASRLRGRAAVWSAVVVVLGWLAWASGTAELGLTSCTTGCEAHTRSALSLVAAGAAALAGLVGAWRALVPGATVGRSLAAAALVGAAHLCLVESGRVYAETGDKRLVEHVLGFPVRALPPSGTTRGYADVRAESGLLTSALILVREDGGEERLLLGWGPFRSDGEAVARSLRLTIPP